MQRICAKGLMRELAERSRFKMISARFASTTKRPQVDPHVLNEEVAKEVGATKPNLSGEYMHQKGRVFQMPKAENQYKVMVDDGVLRKEMLPVIPLVFMVVLGAGLGVWTFYRAHVVHPNVALKRSRRETLFELEEPDRTKEYAEQLHDSPLRKMSLHSPIAFVSQVQQQPPSLSKEVTLANH